jgi:acyl-homoserine-lactone acylase
MLSRRYLKFAFVLLIWSGLSLNAPQAAPLPAKDIDKGKTVIYRDEFGVPHIFAPTAEAGIYAMGYAQCEDRLEEQLKNYLRAMGEMAAAFGQGEYLNDLQARLWRHYEVARNNYSRLRPEVRRHLDWFVRGINDYMAAHRNEIPAWWGERRVDVYMAVAHSRQFMWGWPSGQALSELRRAGVMPNFGADLRSSNEMVIAPARSAAKAPLLIIDPHLSWWGAQRFWEFRIHAGNLEGSGFTIPGMPYVGLGHTSHVAWAMTTGGPDTADIYMLKLDPANPTRYQYDGGWKTLTSRKISIAVKGEAHPREITLYDSHNGPVVARQGDKAYVAKLAYAEEVQFAEVFYLFNIARNIEQFKKGLDLNQVMPQNIMAADNSGKIYYQRAGRVPIRPEGFDFSAPVDGSTSRSEWLGIHPAKDLISVTNPAQGYMQNCNIAPDVMMANSPMTPDKYRSYLFNEPAGRTSQRGARAVQLLHQDDSVTVEEAIAIALDSYCYQYDRWTAALKQADSQYGAGYRENGDYQAGLKEILSWNGRSDADSRGALKFYYWRRAVREAMGQQKYPQFANNLADYMESVLKPRGQSEPIAAEELRILPAALASAMQTLRGHRGSLDAVYGDIFRVGRDDMSWPVGGGSLAEEGMATLRAVGFGQPRADHTRWGQSGQTSTQVVLLTKPIRSWTQPPIGQSDRPDSPYYRDQAEKLFSKALMKPSWYEKKELLQHVAGRIELKPPASLGK